MAFQFILNKNQKPLLPPVPILLKKFPDGSKKGLFKCQGCNKSFEAFIQNVKRGTTKSCGCYRDRLLAARTIKHGHTLNGKSTKTYQTWIDMLRRCDKPNTTYYENYGGRGIRVCREWYRFERFLEDMGECPKSMSIERIDNDKNYCKDNCKWASRIEQGRNKRNNKTVNYEGKELLLIEAYEMSKSSIPYSLVHGRINLGWSVTKALSTPVKTRNN